jgi:hypothetical protein
VVVYTFAKNAREEVRASLDEVEGHAVASLRVFVPIVGGEMVPTKKGLTIAVDSLHELKRAVDALCAALPLGSHPET